VHPTQLSKYNTFFQLWYFGLVLAHLFFISGSAETVLSWLARPETIHSLENVASWGSWSLGWGVGASTIWTGLEYAFRKDTVKFLGSDAAYNAKHYRIGRTVHGTAFAMFLLWAAWWWQQSRQREDEKQKSQEEPTVNSKT
jgi:cardiolipin synthase (CMP-forming)